ncbi:MAG: hypothetical protein IPK97_16640 [Ahniella sp.]|nr:hypothetical protein [Ahniella sp.]
MISRNIGRDSIIDSYIQSTVTGLTNRLTMESVVLANNQHGHVGSCGTVRLSNTNNQSRVILRHVTMADNRMDGGAVSRGTAARVETAATTQVSVYSSIIEPRVGNSVGHGQPTQHRAVRLRDGARPLSAVGHTILQIGLPYRFVHRASYDLSPSGW